MPYFTEHGTLGGIFYFVLLQASLLVLGLFLTVSLSPWVMWPILLWGFYVGALPDLKAIRTNGTWKPWYWRRDEKKYYDTHFGESATWYISRWKQVWTLPYIAHIFIDRPFHEGMTADRKPNWWFGEWMHLIFNLTVIVTIMIWENAI